MESTKPSAPVINAYDAAQWSRGPADLRSRLALRRYEERHPVNKGVKKDVNTEVNDGSESFSQQLRLTD